MENAKNVTERLAQLRKRAGLSMGELAKRLGYRTASGYQRYENPDLFRKDRLPGDLVDKLTGVLVGLGNPPITSGEVIDLGKSSLATPLYSYDSPQTPRSELMDTSLMTGRDSLIPIYGFSGDCDEAQFNFNAGDSGREAPHPAQIGRRGGFAFYVSTDVMAPRFEHGDIAYGLYGAPPKPGQDCVVELNTGDALIRRFITREFSDYVVGNYKDPTERETFSSSSVRALHAVVGRG